jgi:tetratricopeptide (TPR) repeat protein
MQKFGEQSFPSKLKLLFTTLSTKKAILIIVAVGIIVFFNGIFNGFIGDDTVLVIGNPAMQSIGNIRAFFKGLTYYNGGAYVGFNYRPLLITFFSFVYTFFGQSQIAFHFFQIALHIINTCILFIFFKHFFKKPLSFFLSLIFLVHPINSEVAFYISNGHEALFFFFGIIALSLLSIPKSQKYVVPLAAISVLLSLLSKETGILFGMMAIACVGFFNKRRLFPLLGASLVTAIIYLSLRINAVGFLGNSASSPIDRLTLLERFYNMPLIFLFYIKTFLFPLNLALSYQWAYKQVSIQTFFLPLALDLLFLAAIFVFGVLLYKKCERKYVKTYLFFALWFIFGMLFHLQIIPLDVTAVQRWFYFPIVGILGMAGVLVEAFNFDKRNNWKIVCMVILLMLLSVRTFIRSFDWRDEFTLDSHDIKVSQDAYDLENGMSAELNKQGRFEEGKMYAERSIALFPYFTNYINLGTSYIGLKDYQSAKDAYLKALQYGDYYIIYENLGGLTLLVGNTNENIAFLKSALQKFPQDAKLWLCYSIIEFKLGNIDIAKMAVTNAHTYDQSSESDFFYYKIMNNQPFNIKFTTGGY